MAKRFVSIGECMIEMSGGAEGNYRMGFAGDTLNTAWYMRALLPADWQVDYVTALGDDRYSRQMRGFFAQNGIGTDHVQEIAGRRPGLYLIHQEAGDRHFTYWRDMAAAKLLAEDQAALERALGGADLIYFSGITLAILAPRARGRLIKAMVAARNGGARIAFDPNVRPALWTSPKIMASALTVGATIADVVLPTHSDEAPVFGDASAQATAARYLELGVGEVVVKDGALPALAASGAERHEVAPQGKPEVVDTTGAGDSFNAGFLAARLMNLSLAEAVTRAHGVAGIVIGHKGALVDKALVEPLGWSAQTGSAYD